MPTEVEVLLVATGFTGALTFRWLFGLFVSLFAAPRSLTPHFVPVGEASQQLMQAIAGAKREILILADRLTSRPVAQALIDARLKGLSVEILLDAAEQANTNSELPFLVEQGLTPLVVDRQRALGAQAILDGQQVWLGNFTLSTASDIREIENLLILRGETAIASQYRDNFMRLKAEARAVAARPAPAVASTAPAPTASPSAKPAPPMNAPSMPSPSPSPKPTPTPTVSEQPPPHSTPKPSPPMPVQPVTPPVSVSVPLPKPAPVLEPAAAPESEPEPMPIEIPVKPVPVPVVTQASADLMARLRQELAGVREEEDDDELQPVKRRAG